MNYLRGGTGIFLALLAITTNSRANGGFGASGGAGTSSAAAAKQGIGGASRPVGIGGGALTGGPNPGMIGMGGACGPMGFAGGCTGYGFCGFTGCAGGNPFCFGSMSGCFDGGYLMSTQTYSKWAPSPTKAYYHRTLTIQTPPPNETALEFVLIHYPDRPKFFYYFDPADKKYFGRYRVGARSTDCFHVLNFPDRKPSLKDIKDSSWRGAAGMAAIPHVVRPRPGATIEPILQNLKLLRPPESIPDDLLGLPAEEPALRKPPPKK